MKVYCDQEHIMLKLRVVTDKSDLDFYQCDKCRVRKFTSQEDQDRWNRYASKSWVKFWSWLLGHWL